MVYTPNIVTQGRKRPGAYVLHGQEGVGKTSFGAYAPKPIFLQTKGEAGLDTLIDAGQLPEIPHFAGETQDWSELLNQITWLLTAEHDHKTLVIDTLGGAESLCHEHVCKRDYQGKWGDDGFMSYRKGYDRSLVDWRQLLNGFDKLRTDKGMAILALCHTAKVTFKNPEGTDYERYEPAFAHRGTWGVTHKWADCVLFLNFHVQVEKDSKKATKGKGVGGQVRMIYTEHHAAYDAKNRFGLPEEIDAGESGKEAWDNFATALKDARKDK
jgi:hypothetical protein